MPRCTAILVATLLLVCSSNTVLGLPADAAGSPPDLQRVERHVNICTCARGGPATAQCCTQASGVSAGDSCNFPDTSGWSAFSLCCAQHDAGGGSCHSENLTQVSAKPQ